MGAGKTTVGEKVAQNLDLPFLDLDQLIANEAQASIPTLFARGEDYFRLWERKVLTDVLQQEEFVLATGGGVVEDEGNLELLLTRATVFFLELPLKTLWERTGGEGGAGKRPLLAGGYSQFAARYKSREARYLRAHYTIDGSGEPEEIAGRIIKSWREQCGDNNAQSRGE